MFLRRWLGAAICAVGALAAACAPHVEVGPAGAPACAWGVELSARTLDKVNLAAPDTAAAYWALRYAVHPGLAITVHGRFPDARYMSFNSYDSRFRSFTTDGVGSALADYVIKPDHSSTNPWQKTTLPGGSYTVSVSSKVTTGQVNSLPLAPSGAGDGDTGYLILRTYLPTGGPAAVNLPTVTFTTPTTSRTLQPCGTNDDDKLAAATTARAGQPLPNRPPSEGFRRLNSANISAFPNADIAYLSYTLTPPNDDQVLVVRGKAPARPVDDHPTPWPKQGLGVRYFSLCSYPSIFPAPVTRNRMPDGSYDDGCRDDDHTKLDPEGFYTYAVGTEAQREQIEKIPAVTFVPFSADHPNSDHFLLLRNLLSDNDFGHTAQNVPPDTTPEQAAAIMGKYYPRSSVCPLSTLAAQGASSCTAS